MYSVEVSDGLRIATSGIFEGWLRFLRRWTYFFADLGWDEKVGEEDCWILDHKVVETRGCGETEISVFESYRVWDFKGWSILRSPWNSWTYVCNKVRVLDSFFRSFFWLYRLTMIPIFIWFYNLYEKFSTNEFRH